MLCACMHSVRLILGGSGVISGLGARVEITGRDSGSEKFVDNF